MTQLEKRVSKLEETQEQSRFCLLYKDDAGNTTSGKRKRFGLALVTKKVRVNQRRTDHG